LEDDQLIDDSTPAFDELEEDDDEEE